MWRDLTSQKRDVGHPAAACGTRHAAPGRGRFEQLFLVAEQGGCGPQHGRLAMQVSGFALAVQVVLHAVQLAGAGADLGDIVVLVNIANDGDPGTPRRWSVGGRVQPAVFDAGTGKLDSMQYYL